MKPRILVGLNYIVISSISIHYIDFTRTYLR